jgi:glucoamylase
MNPQTPSAPGSPGISARWTSSAKTGVGTSLTNESHVWFTLSHGIFNEIYYPHIDRACVRDMGLIVTDGVDFFSEEKRAADSEVHWLADGVPAFRLVNTCREGRYRIEKQIVTDPHRDTVLQQVQFTALRGTGSDYRLHVLLAPHLGNQGGKNTAWVGEFEDRPLLFAQRGDNALALACSVPWGKRSAGYVGVSDGWLDLKMHKKMTWEYPRAEDGNVAIMAEIGHRLSQGPFVLALGFGRNTETAARSALDSLSDGFDRAKRDYIAGWRAWMKTGDWLDRRKLASGDLSRISLAILRTHESKTTAGALIASLSIPWGFSKGDNDLGGYHLVWSRDLVEAAGGLLAAGAHDDVRSMLSFLEVTQQSDGHWPQNMWADGTPFRRGIQMDETALPLLLVDLARRQKALSEADVTRLWPMIRRAAGYLVRNGPASPEDRWEEDAGYSPFTVGAVIAALLVAADYADSNAEGPVATYLRETADGWNASIDRWMYVSAGDWLEKYRVSGYYIQVAPPEQGTSGPEVPETVHVKNVSAADDTRLAAHMVSPGALALVRFGLRAADDPRIRDTIKIVDALLRVETTSGPMWHRYNGDGYGEHADGSPFDGTGIGRGWPLLTGERAHYELAAGREKEAERLMTTLESFANEGGLIPEQVWDGPDIPERGLHFGRPSGSAMPLVWAHAEYLKLRRSLNEGRIFDLPPQTVRRYLTEKTVASRVMWRFSHKIRSLPRGHMLRVETLARATVHWTTDDWATAKDEPTKDVGLGTHVADLATEALPEGGEVKFTFYWPQVDHWEGSDFVVHIDPGPPDAPGRPEPMDNAKRSRVGGNRR